MRTRVISGLACLSILLSCQNPLPTGSTALDSRSRTELTGPSRVAPGETAQFQLTVIGPGGARRDVTSAAAWTTSKAAVATVAGGLVTGNAMGDVTISAVFDLLGASQPVTVLAPGTYRVSGFVHEPGSSVPLSGVTVQSRGAGNPEAETVTGADGRFTLYGVPALADLRLTKPGYLTSSQRLELQDNTSLDLALEPASARPDFSGTYRLSISAANCGQTSTPLPPELTQRVYTAAVTQAGRKLDVEVSGAEFVQTRIGAPHFTGTAEIAGATFSIAAADNYYSNIQPELVERLSSSTVLVVSGFATTTLSGSTLSGTLQGSIVEAAGDPFGRRIAQCQSSAMPFVMTRQ